LTLSGGEALHQFRSALRGWPVLDFSSSELGLSFPASDRQHVMANMEPIPRSAEQLGGATRLAAQKETYAED
jgi:hypothetical protein